VEREPREASRDVTEPGDDWVERQPAWLRSPLIRIDRAICAVAAVLENLHRNLTVFSGSAEDRQDAERINRYRRLPRGTRLGCLFVSALSLAAACAVFWLVFRD
jgi:hypothetical protein